jgi:hypothetical protein
VRERFDAGTGLVGIGAVLLLVSLFVDWYRPGGNAWAVFESVDLALAGVAICALVAMAPRLGSGGLGRALPIIAAVAFAIVVVQLIDPPPSARDSELHTGAWLALAGTSLMACGALLGAASISVTIDVRGRERRRRAAAIDAREAAAETADTSAAAPPGPRRRSRRDESLLEPRERREPGGPESAEDPDRTQALEPVDPVDPPKET